MKGRLERSMAKEIKPPQVIISEFVTKRMLVQNPFRGRTSTFVLLYSHQTITTTLVTVVVMYKIHSEAGTNRK